MSLPPASIGPRRPRLFIDGHNLALTQGTGVATYARNLSFALGRLGYEVGVLYGHPAAPSLHPLLREITFFDERVATETPALWLIALRRLRRMLFAPIGEVAQRVPVTGQVVANGFRDRLPHFDEIWNTQDLFRHAVTHFDLFSSLRPVRLRPRPDLMHWTYPLPLRAVGTRNIYTMHDLVPLRLPYTTLDNKRRYFRLARLLGRSADHIVTVSEASRRDIISLLGVPEERVTNTYQAVEIPRRLTELPLPAVHAEIAGSFGLTPDRFYLFVGAIEPKKNIGRMIQAYLASGVEAPLVLAGKRAWQADPELRLLFPAMPDAQPNQRSAAPPPRGYDHLRHMEHQGGVTRVHHRVLLLDYVPYRLLVGLMRSARALLFPSLYEGFGLPALEAMLLGTPVITSNTASMPEVVGDAALQVDPYDISALVQAIQAVDRDPALRARLAAAGPARAALFSPERYAARLSALYGRLGVAPPLGATTTPELVRARA